MSAIKIRDVQDNDQSEVMDLLRAYHAKTVFGAVPFSAVKYERLAEQVKGRGDTSIAVVAEKNGALCGFIWASVAEYILTEDVLITTVRLLVIDDDVLSKFERAKTALRLIAVTRDWSRSRGAVALIFNFSGGVDPVVTAKLARRAGGTYLGGNYAIRI